MRAFTDVVSDFGFGSQVAWLTEITPTAISADGRYIAGTSTFQDSLFYRGPQAFVPVPEPSAYGIVSAAFLTAVAFWRRFGNVATMREALLRWAGLVCFVCLVGNTISTRSRS